MTLHWRRLIGYDFVKRVADVLVAGAALALLWPVLAIVALAVRTMLGRPVIFAQDRPGLHGRIFTLYKFRSMREVDVDRGVVTDSDRLTPFGRWLRATSLDELPSLWNVLRGDMSLVGPRPLLPEYLPLYSVHEARRHEVRPGITGLAQVSGRNALTWQDKFDLDVQYVNRRSVVLDATILMRTVGTVVRHEGVSESGHVTTTRFEGSGSAD